MSKTKEPAWFADAQDDFLEVFCEKGKATEEEAKAYFDKWLEKCESDEERDLFEQACKDWLSIATAVKAILKEEEKNEN